MPKATFQYGAYLNYVRKTMEKEMKTITMLFRGQEKEGLHAELMRDTENYITWAKIKTSEDFEFFIFQMNCGMLWIQAFLKCDELEKTFDLSENEKLNGSPFFPFRRLIPGVTMTKALMRFMYTLKDKEKKIK